MLDFVGNDRLAILIACTVLPQHANKIHNPILHLESVREAKEWGEENLHQMYSLAFNTKHVLGSDESGGISTRIVVLLGEETDTGRRGILGIEFIAVYKELDRIFQKIRCPRIEDLVYGDNWPTFETVIREKFDLSHPIEQRMIALML